MVCSVYFCNVAGEQDVFQWLQGFAVQSPFRALNLLGTERERRRRAIQSTTCDVWPQLLGMHHLQGCHLVFFFFFLPTVTYLGKVVGCGQVKHVHSKVKAILSFPVPVSWSKQRHFLGMAGYYCSFCKKFSAIAAQLTDLLSHKTHFLWSENCWHEFKCIEGLLKNAPTLAAPAFDQPFKLFMDASDTGVGAVLVQVGDDDVDHPVSYFSK